VHENDFIFLVGIRYMGISVESIRLISEITNYEFVSLNLLLKSSAGNNCGWWARLLQDPVDDGVAGSSSGVVLLLSLFEEVQSWEALDAESLCEFLLYGGINFG
jgi:hypothetical protein